VQRASAEEWRLRREVCTPAYPAHIVFNYSLSPVCPSLIAGVPSCVAQELETLEWIGSGQCAAVYKTRWRGMYAVAKVLKGANDYREGWTLDSAREDLVHEISVISHLRHPNLVLFLGAVLQQDTVILLNEFMDGGNLEECVSNLKTRHAGSRAHVPRKHCAKWGIDLGQALTFLHACNPPSDTSRLEAGQLAALCGGPPQGRGLRSQQRNKPRGDGRRVHHDRPNRNNSLHGARGHAHR
jgi:hypothetical protein